MEIKTCCRCLIVLFVLITYISCVNGGRKRVCSRVFRRIPVQRKFKINKFLGTWYTVTRSTYIWGNHTYESASIEFRENADGSYSYSTTGKLGDTCTPVETGTLVPKRRKGIFVMQGADSRQTNVATLMVSFTDYQNTALIYYCFKYKPGRRDQCHRKGKQVEILTRSEVPKKKTIKSYMRRAGKRLCVPNKDLRRTKPGLCKIPDILEDARRKKSKTTEALDPVPIIISVFMTEINPITGIIGTICPFPLYMCYPRREPVHLPLEWATIETESKHSVKCAVNNIPVQKNFSLSEMEGLWYEIARTRYTFNKMESVVSYHRYDEFANRINSYYTGTVTVPNSDDPPTCMTAIQGMSKTKDKSKEVADMEGRIGGEDSKYPWSPMKVLYADDQYLMFYACYAGESESPCMQAAMEVTLVGRTRDIDADKRQAMYSHLTDICVEPTDMIETVVHANCSSWVLVETEVDEIQPDDCGLDNIEVYKDFTNDQVVGTWYLYASINYNENISYRGVILEKTIGAPSELIRTKMTASLPGQNCTVYSTDSRDRCLNTGDHITTLPEGGYGSFVFTKTLHLSDDLLIEYICNQRNIEGSCDAEGIFFNVYTRNSSILTVDSEAAPDSDDGDEPVDHTELIAKLARSVCLDPAKLKYENAWCDQTEVAADAVSGEDEEGSNRQCDVDNLTIFSDVEEYTQEGIYGYWYEIASSKGSDDFGNRNSLVAYFTSDNNQTLQVYYAGYETGSDNCSMIEHEMMIPRCMLDSSGDYLIKLRETDDFVSYVPFKIIYTDYSNVLMTYTCHEILSNGTCCDSGAHVRIWGRNTTLADDIRDYANEMVYWVCLDPSKDGFMVDKTEEYSETCYNGLHQYVNETLSGKYDDVLDFEDENAGDEDGVETSNQRDEEQYPDDDDDFFNDIFNVLDMDDDAFYNGY